MKLKSIIIISIFITICSCKQEDWQVENKSIRPICELTDIEYSKDEFEKIKSYQLLQHHFWLTMNHSKVRVGVEIENGEVKFAKPKNDLPFFELEDGKLEIINNGEFGGALNFIPNDNVSDTTSIWKVPINFVFEFKSKIYFLVGIAHGSDTGGALFELERKRDKFSYKEIVKLDSAPEAVSIYENKILVAGHRMFTVIENFEKYNLVEEAFWRSLSPNSIAVKNDDEVYVGMMGGYSKLSLNSKEIEYYKYKEN